MTDDDVIKMAIKAALSFDSEEYPDIWLPYLHIGKNEIMKFAELVAAHERKKYEKDAARWQALKTVNGRVQWYRHEGDAIVANEAWSSDFGGLDQAMDAWIEKARQP